MINKDLLSIGVWSKQQLNEFIMNSKQDFSGFRYLSQQPELEPEYNNYFYVVVLLNKELIALVELKRYLMKPNANLYDIKPMNTTDSTYLIISFAEVQLKCQGQGLLQLMYRFINSHIVKENEPVAGTYPSEKGIKNNIVNKRKNIITKGIFYENWDDILKLLEQQQLINN